MVDLTYIKDLFDEVIDGKREGVPAINRENLYENGAIFYENGDNGTDYEYRVNQKTCDFRVYYEDGTPYIKCYQNAYDVVMYIFNRSGKDRVKKKIIIPAKDDLFDVCAHLQATFDNMNVYEDVVEKWILRKADYTIGAER